MSGEADGIVGTTVRHKRELRRALAALAGDGADALATNLPALYGTGPVRWRGSAPLDEIDDLEVVAERVWRPLMRALPDLERRDEIVVGGRFEGRDYVATLGHYVGTFARDWLGIPPTGLALYLRYGEVHRLEDGRVSESSCLWDILDAMRQGGCWPLPPSLGREGRWPGPLGADGVVLDASDPAESARNLAQTLAMHRALAEFAGDERCTREDLLEMPQKAYWHPRMMWYGPAGIGTTRALAGFVDAHQLPFRRAFPKRKGGTQWDEIPEKRDALGGGHYVRIGDGPYSVTGGWPSVYAVHAGDGWLGLAATGREVGMRVMDFYRHDEGLIRENWVPLDVIDVLRQLGVDVYERLAQLLAGRRIFLPGAPGPLAGPR